MHFIYVSFDIALNKPKFLLWFLSISNFFIKSLLLLLDCFLHTDDFMRFMLLWKYAVYAQNLKVFFAKSFQLLLMKIAYGFNYILSFALILFGFLLFLGTLLLLHLSLLVLLRIDLKEHEIFREGIDSISSDILSATLRAIEAILRRRRSFILIIISGLTK